MIVFAAYVPSSPILMGYVNPSKKRSVAKTMGAMTHLRRELYAAKPDAIIVIYPEIDKADYYAIISGEKVKSDFSGVGDFATIREFRVDGELANLIFEKAGKDFDMRMQHESALSTFVSMPLVNLTDRQTATGIIPISLGQRPYEEIYNLGEVLRECCEESGKRIAVIGIGNLSYCSSKAGPAPFSSAGKKFDKAVIASCEAQMPQNLLNIPRDTVEEAHECGLNVMVAIQGVVSQIQHTSEILSYEHPFGIGYLSTYFRLY